jgi:hypothetical protein
VETVGYSLPPIGASLLDRGVRTGTEAIPCNRAAYGPAVAIKPLGSWMPFQCEVKGSLVPKEQL